MLAISAICSQIYLVKLNDHKTVDCDEIRHKPASTPGIRDVFESNTPLHLPQDASCQEFAIEICCFTVQCEMHGVIKE